MPKQKGLRFFSVGISFFLLMTTTFCQNKSAPNSRNDKKTTVLLITSGHHRFDTTEFFDLFFSMKDVEVDTLSQPFANQSLLSDSIEKYDALVFFDMWQTISDQEKKAFVGLTKSGVGLVFLHHSLVSYQEWPQFTEIIGGKYFHDRFSYAEGRYSTFKHDISFRVNILNGSHPITKGLSDFDVLDEGYGNIMILPGVAPFLSTKHPNCDEWIGWTNAYNASRIVYILPGNGPTIFKNPTYRQLVKNAIKWSSRME